MKLIISDLDGTLLNNESKVTEKSKETLKKIKAQGFEVAIATGRSFHSANLIREFIGIDMYLICNNGANIYNKDGSILKRHFIPINLSKKIIDILHKEKISYKAFNGIDVYLPTFGEVYDEIRKEHNLFFIENSDTVPELEKVLIIEDNEKRLFEIRDLMIKYFENELEIVISSEDCLDLNMKDCSKKLGVETIAQALDIDKKDIMAFGDSGNDYKMLQFVGYPVAMKDSYMSTKGFKNITYFTNDENGVADYLERKFL